MVGGGHDHDADDPDNYLHLRWIQPCSGGRAIRDHARVRPEDHSFSFNPEDTQPQLERIIRLAVKYDVKFYTFDARGLYTAASLPGSSFDASNGRILPEAVDQQIASTGWQNGGALARLARETGGLFFENNNDLLKGIQRAFADGRDYYVLAYIPTNNAFDGKFRKIKVTVKGKKLMITAKSGYWAN